MRTFCDHIIIPIIIIIIIIVEFLTSQLWLGNIHLSWDVVINRIRLDGLICNLDSVIMTLELLPLMILLSGSLVLPFAST